MVPWNYDRSKPSVVSLFLNHVDRFSLCVHGNNHDHREFSENVPLSQQEDDIIQGLARMEAFTRLTGIPYDRIMVFPHSVAQVQTNKILKKNNFLGTVNGENIPPDVERPESLLAYLRNSTLEYGDFLSLKRTRVEWESESNIALNLFLENPILLYSHHDLFRGGPDKFNDRAARINELEPTIRWTSLGTIVKNLYLLRKRARGDYEVLTLSPNIEISNPRDIPLRFEIQKPELDSSPLREVLVDGSPYPYERTSGSIHLVLMIPALATREINIEYENPVDLDSVDLSKKGSRVRWLRKISDFRDNFLSLLPFGSNIVGFYYDSGAFRGGSRVVFLFLIIFIGLIAIVSWRIIRRIRKARLKKKALRRPV
jgi:hypothetical protein